MELSSAVVMESSSKIILALLLISMLSISSATDDPILQPDCGHCFPTRPHKPKKPITLPPIVKPPVTVVPKVPVVPPVIVPKVPVVPPVFNPPDQGKVPCPPPPAAATSCPVDTLKLGACVDLLGGLVHIGLGDPAANECCPIISGLVELEAAACLCTTLKIKALNLNIYVPLALQLLVTCGKTPPPGYTCSF